MSNIRPYLYGVALMVAVALLNTYYYCPSMIGSADPSDSTQSVVGDSVKRIAQLRQCIADRLPGLWKNLTSIVNTCTAKHTLVTRDTFDRFHMGRLGEIKYFLPFRTPPTSGGANCTLLTVGIGGDIQVEKEFTQKYGDHCRVFGIEPSSDQVVGFAKYGTVIPKAVGTVSDKLTMRVRVGASYKFEKVEIVPLSKLLDEYVHSRLVTFSTMDIEGFEYRLIAALVNGETFDREGISFCQIDVELHALKMETKFNKTRNGFDAFFTDLLMKSPYIPMTADGFLSHKKVTFINIENSECERLFGFRRYFI